MTRRLLVTYLTLTAVTLAALVVPLGVTFSRRERDRLYFDIERDASAVASLVEDALEEGRPLPVAPVLADYHRRTSGRIVVLDAHGLLLADSDQANVTERDFSTRPEVAAALAGKRAVGSRESTTLQSGLLYVAVPVTSGGVVHGAVRVTFPTAARDRRVRAVWATLLALSAVILGVVTAVGYLLARSVTRPVRDLEDAVERVAAGDLAARAPTGEGVPEVRQLAETFNRTASRLEELVGAQQRFVADAAHQLRTPLTALRLRLENLGAAATPADAAAFEATQAEVQRLSAIVDGLLALARAEGAPAAVTTVDLAAVAVDRVEAWRDVAAEQEVALLADVPGAVWASAPPDGMEQVLDNLLANALNVAPARSTVRVEVRAAGEDAEVHVVDEGPGLDAEQRERAFERFWRGSATTPGTGLGLSAVRQIARSAGGDARLDAGPGGRGVDAVVTLPVATRTFTEP